MKANIIQPLKHLKARIFDRQSLVQNANTPFQTLYDDGLAKLRHYPALPNFPKKYRTPILFVTPLAVSTAIYDLLPHRSLIQFLLQHGFSVYIIDWGKPTRKHHKLGFDYYVGEALPNIVKTVKQHANVAQISMHGWSMGGLFTLMYNAYSQDDSIKNMVLLGTPIDGHASGYIGKLSSTADTFFSFLEKNLQLHPRQIPAFFLHSYGWMNMLAFKAVDPIGNAKTNFKMLKHLKNHHKMIENATKSDFLVRMTDYPGEVIKDIGIGFWLENKIIKGTFTIKDKPILLENIHSNLLIMSGKSDALVTTQSAKPILDKVQSDDTTHIEIPGGHVSIVCSQKNTEVAWPKLAKWLKQRSEVL